MNARKYTYRQINVAKEQAAISDRKSQLKKQEGDEQASFVYRVRAKALRMYTKHLFDTMNKERQKANKAKK